MSGWYVEEVSLDNSIKERNEFSNYNEARNHFDSFNKISNEKVKNKEEIASGRIWLCRINGTAIDVSYV